MGNELIIAMGFSFSKAGVKIQFDTRTVEVDVAGGTAFHHIESVGLTAEDLPTGDITAIGYCWFRNLDTTNFVQLGAAGKVFMKLKPLEEAIIRLGTEVPQAIADTAPVELEYIMVED
ncbi:MAG: hypothetical protein ACXABY_19770 [Candidatus Thorarchaeota archaeon]|jgi:hypothetical protein